MSEEEKIEEKNESYWNKGDIHTVFAIKNGCFDKVDKKRLEEKNYFYRLYSKVDWIAIIDFDKNDLIPLTKDILNRQNVFLEIKLLKIALFFLGFLTVGLSVCIVLIFWIKETDFAKDKAEIITQIKTVEKILQQKPIESPINSQNAPIEQNIPKILEDKPTKKVETKIDTGVKPVYPPVIESTKKTTSPTAPTVPEDNAREVPDYSASMKEDTSISTPNSKRNVPNYAN